MSVLRIVPNLPARDPSALAAFYATLFDLEIEHQMGWISFLAGPSQARAQLQTASEGGSGTPLPALTISVDDLDTPLARLRASGAAPVYGPVTEPWGVRRFYLRDPEGNLVNVATHTSE